MSYPASLARGGGVLEFLLCPPVPQSSGLQRMNDVQILHQDPSPGPALPGYVYGGVRPHLLRVSASFIL